MAQPEVSPNDLTETQKQFGGGKSLATDGAGAGRPWAEKRTRPSRLPLRCPRKTRKLLGKHRQALGPGRGSLDWAPKASVKGTVDKLNFIKI